MHRILCSTGALIGRPNGRDYRLMKEADEKLDCDGFELMMYEDWHGKFDEIEDFVKTLTKPIPAFHAEKNIGEFISRDDGHNEEAIRLFEANCELARRVNAEKVVLHLWNGEYSDRNFPHNLEFYPIVRDIAKKYDLVLAVENVVCNTGSPTDHLIELMNAYPDICFTYDTKMAEFHGEIPRLTEAGNTALMKHIVHMHMNDYKGNVMQWENLKTLHIGDGQIDFTGLVEFLKASGYNGDYTIESTSFDKTGFIDFEKMQQSIDRLRALVL